MRGESEKAENRKPKEKYAGGEKGMIKEVKGEKKC